MAIPGPVLVEVEYLLTRRRGLATWLELCAAIAGGTFAVTPESGDVLARAADIQRRYADQPIGFVDAAVFASCELLGEAKVATLDHRHFSIMRTAAGRALELLPAN